jgi:hypothetical protein
LAVADEGADAAITYITSAEKAVAAEIAAMQRSPQ